MTKEILFVTGIYPPDIGGPATYIPEFMNYVEAENIGTRLVTLTSIHKIGNKRKVFVTRHVPKVIRVIRTTYNIFRQSLQADVIFSNGLYEETALSQIFRGKPVVAKIVGDPIWERYRNATGSDITIEDFQNHQLPIRYRLQRVLLNRSLARFQYLTTPSSHLATIVRKWGLKNPIMVIENGTACATQIDLEIEYDIVAISRLVSWKNLDALILSLKNSDYRIAIAGIGPEESKLKKLAKELNLSIDFVGHLNNDEVTSLLDKSKIFVLNSEYEGLSFALIQAMMLGKAVIVSSIPGNEAVISNYVNGLVVNGQSTEQIRSAINLLISNPQLARSIGMQAKQDAQARYCLENQLGKMMSLVCSQIE